MKEDNEKEYVILTDEYDDEYMYELIDRVEFNGVEYGLLVSVMLDENDNTEDEEAELVIVRVTEDEDGEEIFEEIEDDDEYDELVEYLVDEGIGIRKELH